LGLIPKRYEGQHPWQTRSLISATVAIALYLSGFLNAIAPTGTLTAIMLAENDKSFVNIFSFDAA